MLSGKLSVLPLSRRKQRSIPVIQKDHWVVSFRRITSPRQNVWREFSLKLLQSPLLAFHSLSIHWFSSQPGVLDRGFSTTQKSQYWQPKKKQWVQAGQVLIRTGDCEIIFCTKSLHPLLTGKLLIFSFLSLLLFSLSLSPSAASDLLYSCTLANTQFYCNVWYDRVLASWEFSAFKITAQ